MFSLDCHGCNVGAKEVVVAKWASIKRVDNLDNLGGQPGTAVRDTIKVHYPARALRALGLLPVDGAPTVGRGKTF